jgi:transcriptional adapter 2-alpha
MSEEKGKGKKKKDEAPIILSELEYICDYCKKDISNTVRIRCAECEAELDFCIECWSMGVEIKKHKNTHDYRIIDNMQFPFYSLDWSADEEAQMLEGMEQEGWGNWEDVSVHVNTKTKNEVREHYMKFYHCPPTWLPENVKPLSTRQDVMAYNRDPSLLDKVAPRLRGPNRTSTRITIPKTPTSKPVRHDLANYMPLRDEFEIEWNNDAEMSIRDILFEGPEEPQTDVEVKLKLLEIYNMRLDERDEKRAFVIERGLHDTRKTREAEKKRSKEERDLMAKTRKLLSLPAMAGEAYDRFIDDLYAEQCLRQRIQEFQQYRTLGLKTMSEVETYKAEMASADNPKRGRAGAKKSGQDDRYMKKGAAGRNMRLMASSSSLLQETAKSAAADWMSDLEREVSMALRMEPEAYAAKKETMIREYVKRGEVRRAHLRQLFKSEPLNRLVPLFDFWEECGWLNKRTPSNQADLHLYQQKAQSMMMSAPGMTTRGALQQQQQQAMQAHAAVMPYGPPRTMPHHPGYQTYHAPAQGR